MCFTYPFFLPFPGLVLANNVFATPSLLLLFSKDLDFLTSDSMSMVRLVASFALCFCRITLAKSLSFLKSSDKSIGGDALLQNTFDDFVLDGSDGLNGILPRLD